jgi:hypothetical protein
MKNMNRLILIACILGAIGYAYWKLVIPTHHVEVRSQLVMMGDLDDDHHWTKNDLKILDAFLHDPFSMTASLACHIDMNQNGLIDGEDLDILRSLVSAKGDPYAAEDAALAAGKPFPRPRECYRYISVMEYHARPLFALPYPLARDSDIDWLVKLRQPVRTNSYGDALEAALYSEAIRLDQAWRKRKPDLLPIEREYAAKKLARAKALFQAGERYELLLAVMELVEDAETLTERGQPEVPVKMLAFRDHLREVLASKLYDDFKSGKKDWRVLLKAVSGYLKSDLGLVYDFGTLGPPRDMTHLENYLQRTEWQYYKSTTRKEDFLALIGYAQHDPRYLRAVSRTSRKLLDPNVENHNLPMVLLFREALRIKNGDKKKAVGLLDEAIRIPYAWIRSIPREKLPGSLALDNFLLPGNKEDGADKSRHWNVFGGVCLYKSPQEALDLALRREMQDLRDGNYTEEAMREFFRDMIANINGMYHIMTVNPGLIAGNKGSAPVSGPF